MKKPPKSRPEPKLKSKYSGRPILKRVAAGLAVLVAVPVLVIAGLWLWAGGQKTPPQDIVWGYTYSSYMTKEELGLDSQPVYLAALDELKPKIVRLVAYWQYLQPTADSWDFSDLDFQVAEAEKRGIPYIIAVGNRVPRYPECFTPAWAKDLSGQQRQAAVLRLVETVVRRYDGGRHLLRWQVENEPYLGLFGICPPLDEDLLKKEVALVRSLSSKDILITDSGELSTWYQASGLGDVFGTTMYRKVYDKTNGKVFRHIIPAEFYTRRANLMKKLHPGLKQVVNAELQAEPWADAPLSQKDEAFYNKTLDHQQFKDNIEFAQATGLEEVYLWGVEWWYLRKLQGDSFYWDNAKALFNQSAR
ncbi:MAG TPA: hypothetical protein VK963_02640 [Candidatus Saccharimonadales bacterium]|nr:hypothetical protein [Candidatus Saccharimonadales bacterium]